MNAPLCAPIDEEFWINCTFTSQSLSKALYLTKANLDLLERSKLKILQKVDLGGGPTNLDFFSGNISVSDVGAIRLDPQESYECIFKLKPEV